jgi:tetratricopeptide (TPR) repeat protein
MHDRERRQRAADLFNLVWRFLEKPDRTPEEDETMVHAAHASRFYWGETGTAANWARGDWQISRVYSTLGRAEPALHHAERCLEACLANPDAMAPFDLPYAYEALARAYAVAGDADQSRHYLSLARQVGERIEDADDRELLMNDLEFDPEGGSGVARSRATSV